jgi:hypothetical protein
MIDIKNIVGNPPYNESSQGRAPIYHKITELQRTEVAPDNFAWIVQYNWLTQLSSVGREMRKSLLAMGVYRIEDNRFDGFTEATVRTCTIYCRKNYSGDIELVDRLYNQSSFITAETFKELQISPVYAQDERALLKKLNGYSYDMFGRPLTWTIIPAPLKGEILTDYSIAVSYFADFTRGNIGKIQIVGPDKPMPGSHKFFDGYVNLGSKERAEQVLAQLTSYWHSKVVNFVLSRTLTSRTLDNPQVAHVPVVPCDRVWTDEELYAYFELTDEEIAVVNRARIKTELTYTPNDIITEAIAQAALTEGRDRAVFRTNDRKDANGEVFTPTSLVLHMLTELDPGAWADGETFLDPTCGNGQILAAIAVVKRELGHENILSTIYGTDLMPDNVRECRERLLSVAGDTEENRKIVNTNIVQGNAMFKIAYSKFNETQLPMEVV